MWHGRSGIIFGNGPIAEIDLHRELFAAAQNHQADLFADRRQAHDVDQVIFVGDIDPIEAEDDIVLLQLGSRGRRVGVDGDHSRAASTVELQRPALS